MDSTFKMIPGFEGVYQINKLGVVRSLKRIVKVFNPKSNKTCNRVLLGKVIKPRKIKKGYIQVRLSLLGKVTPEYVHRLVWKTFKGPIPYKMEINHKDLNKTNCKLSNLELVTHKQNLRHAIRSGIEMVFSPGSKVNGMTVLNESSVKEIRRRLKLGHRQVDIARDFFVSRQAITSIKYRKTWDHIK